MARPVVYVIENPQEDPDVFSLGDVEVVHLTSYPVSNWCQDEEFSDYVEGGYLADVTAARDAFPVDSESFRLLDRIVVEFNRRLDIFNQKV